MSLKTFRKPGRVCAWNSVMKGVSRAIQHGKKCDQWLWRNFPEAWTPTCISFSWWLQQQALSQPSSQLDALLNNAQVFLTCFPSKDWSRYISYYEKLQQRDRAWSLDHGSSRFKRALKIGYSYGSIWYYLCWASGSFHKAQAVANAVGISPGFLLKQVDGKRTCSAIWWCGDMRCWFLIQHALKLDAVHGPPWAALFWPRLATGESGDLFNIVKLLSSFTKFYLLRVLLFHVARCCKSLSRFVDTNDGQPCRTGSESLLCVAHSL